MTITATSQHKFLKLLREDILKLDLAELDFGIYRILNYRREEIEEFLAEKLPERIEEVLSTQASNRKTELQTRLNDLKTQLNDAASGLGSDSAFEGEELKESFKGSPKGKRFLQTREALERLNVEAGFNETEEERLYNVLYTFFSRYYEDGDFLPQPRRGRQARFSVDYQGEDVHFSWRGRGSHYIKTSEQLHSYAFKTDTAEVRFQFISADTPKDNVKGDKRYIIPTDEPDIQHNRVTLYFEYRPLNADEAKLYDKNGVQDDLIKDKLEIILPKLAGISVSKEQLEKHLRRYARKNTTDYFVNPNLGEFLSSELDYYLKNEYLNADAFVSPEAMTDRFIKFKVLRDIGREIITFLDQIESFQARLFEKRRFVLGTDYLVQTRHLTDDLRKQVINNEAQLQAWRDLFAANGKIDKAFVDSHPTLVVDTQHFDEVFKRQMLALFDDLDEATDGLLVHAENYGALRTLQPKFASKVKVIYIDPPYNTGGDGFLYKDDFSKHSTWLTMMEERLASSRTLLKQDGVLFASIDDNERVNLETLLLDVFDDNNRVEELIWVQNTTDNTAPTYSTNHEYIEVFARDKATAEKDATMFREPKPGYLEIMEVVEKANPEYPPLEDVEKAIKQVMNQHLEEFKEELQEQGLTYNNETKKIDPWRGIYPYANAEYRDSNGLLVNEKNAKERHARIWIWQSSDLSAPSGKQSDSTRNQESNNYRFYNPPHPVTEKPCPHPKRGWLFPYTTDDDRPSFQKLNDDNRVVYGVDEKNVPRQKRFLHEVETNVSKSVIHDYTDGEKELSALVGATNTFPNPKPTTLLQRLVMQTSAADDVVFDFFAGSGTTGHAIMKANREQNWTRKFLLADMGEHFDSVLLPRIQKVMYSPEWREGKPHGTTDFTGLFDAYPDWVNRSPRLVKVLRLESYEDSLNALELPHEQDARAKGLQSIFGDEYLLKYLLPTEVEDVSEVFLNTEKLETPFDYKLRIHTSEGVKEQPVDLVETFNLLMGYHVKRIFTLAGEREYVCVEARDKDGLVLVLWRDVQGEGFDAAGERAFLEEQLDLSQYGKIYANADIAVPRGVSLDREFKDRLLARATGVLA